MATEQRRFLNTTVKLKSKNLRRLPVKTSANIPMSKINDVMKYLNSVEVQAPIKVLDVIVENVLDLGVNIIATKTVEE